MTNTFEQAFSGAPANGDWALYVFSNLGEAEYVGGWCVDFTLNSGVATATTLSSSRQKQTAQTAATLTATVKAGGTPVSAGGTVKFLDNGLTPLGNSSNSITLNASGEAAYSTGSAYYSLYNGSGYTSVYEGDHEFTAEYSGVTGEDDPSTSTTFWQRFDNASTVSSGGSNQYSYCNAGPILAQSSSLGAFFLNPSNVFVTKLPGTINTAGVTLKGLYTTGQSSAVTQTLLAGPTGAALDFFSNTGQNVVSGNSFTTGDYTFADSASGQVPGTSFTPGSYQPTAVGSSADTFTSSASGFYNIPGSARYGCEVA